MSHQDESSGGADYDIYSEDEDDFSQDEGAASEDDGIGLPGSVRRSGTATTGGGSMDGLSAAPGASGTSNSSRSDFKVLSLDDVTKLMMATIDEVANIVRLPATDVRLLLHHYKWNRELLLERYYEAAEDSKKLSAFYAAARVIDPNAAGTSGSSSQSSAASRRAASAECEVCLSAASPLVGLRCGHVFCVDCWDAYLVSKMQHQGQVYVECQALGCNILLDDERALSYLKTDTSKAQYRRLMTASFVDCARSMRWCPGKDCGRALTASFNADPRTPAQCLCGALTCFACGEDWHEPCPCALMKKWVKKCQDDSETSNWLSANTKECPKCGFTIEKDGGCNHMTCRNAGCRHEFCWMCLGPWEPHGSNWYQCNRFDDSLAKNARDAQEKSRAALQRYLHHYNRFVNHQQSLRLENKLYASIKTKMDQMQAMSMSWIEVQFLKKAVDVLSACRRTLMYTYAFAYYLQSDNQAKIFIDNQSDLEMSTEQLSEFLERDLENENLTTLKQRVQDKYRYVEQRRGTLLRHCTEGIEKDTWRFNA